MCFFSDSILVVSIRKKNNFHRKMILFFYFYIQNQNTQTQLMSLFQKSVINKYLKNLDKEKVSKAYENFQKFYGDKLRLHNIMQLKEENYQEGFLREIFVETLGYTINPDNDFNLTTEFKNLNDARKADGAILRDGKAIGVIELKSTKTKHLESIKEQAFSYKNNQPGCRYVITSNFQSLRFYIDDATEYEEFNLFNLKEKDFKLLYLLLSQESIFSDLPEKLKQETKFHENDISAQLYTDYKRFKNKIFENLVKNNPQYDKLTLFKKSQKLLDRFLFVFFAEDSGLIPPNAVSKIVEQWKMFKENDEYFPLYSRFQKLFSHLDKGYTYKTWGEIPAYNGGLFRNDELLDSDELKIDDEVLEKDSLILSAYDFNTEVDVNILGHIFEHSLNEIENITAQLRGEEIDKKKTKRKKDGIFYTPKYITKYIVESTVGTLCKEKKEELKINNLFIDESYRKTDGKLKEKGKKLYKTFDNYKKWLLTLKILDPACGSGAFLNATLDFLVAEHKQTDNLIAELTGDALGLFDTDKAILENNIYGVDINEESVEIAKLSMWLRTAQKGRPLSDLSGNIKCGNSLIDDPEVAGDKAFDWNFEFKDIMDNGGFDVVIGNPPYVFGGNVGITNEAKLYFKESYKTGLGKVNLFTLFIEKSFNILSKSGEFSFIIPNTFLRVTSYHNSRKFFIDNFKFRELADLGNDVFQGAVTTAIILIAKKANSYSEDIVKIIKNFKGDYTELCISDIIDNNYVIPSNLSIEKLKLLKKINSYSILLGNECEEMIFGVVITKNKGEVVFSEYKEDLKPFLEGKDIGAYNIRPIHSYINYNPELLHRARTKKIFEVEEKLLVQRITGGSKPIKVAYDNNKYYNKESINNIIIKTTSEFHTKTILAFLNSKLINWVYSNLFTNESTLTVNISKEYLSKIPVKLPNNQLLFVEKVDLMLSLNKELQKKSDKFIKRIKSNLELEKITGKLQNFYNYDFKTFIAELKKQKIKLSLTQQDEWEDYFDTYKQEINQVQTQISQTDKEIDKMVYELYELTEVEINIVEESV